MISNGIVADSRKTTLRKCSWPTIGLPNRSIVKGCRSAIAQSTRKNRLETITASTKSGHSGTMSRIGISAEFGGGFWNSRPKMKMHPNKERRRLSSPARMSRPMQNHLSMVFIGISAAAAAQAAQVFKNLRIEDRRADLVNTHRPLAQVDLAAAVRAKRVVLVLEADQHAASGTVE